MKYVILKADLGDGVQQTIPLIFPDLLNHNQVASYIAVLLQREHHLDKVHVFSAGTIRITDAVCSGESETLKVKSRVDDAQRIMYAESVQFIEDFSMFPALKQKRKSRDED